MRLINVDITDSEICDKVQEISTNADVYLVVRKVLASFPTVEAEPIKHGKWKMFKYYIGDSHESCIECSECGAEYNRDDVQRVQDSDNCFAYCPNCGAKMDGR